MRSVPAIVAVPTICFHRRSCSTRSGHTVVADAARNRRPPSAITVVGVLHSYYCTVAASKQTRYFFPFSDLLRATSIGVDSSSAQERAAPLP